MNLWAEPLWAEILYQKTLWFVGGMALCWLLEIILAPQRESRHRVLLSMVALHVVLVLVAGVLRLYHSDNLADVRLPSLWLGITGLLGASLSTLFSIVMPRLQLRAPRLLQDLLFLVVALVTFFVLASRLGFNLSGLIATSAVITAVIGLSLQDTLGHIIAGVAIQFDRAFQEGDWIKYGDISGRVAEVRWRYTTIETRNWETVVVPNKLLIQSHVTVLGRRRDAPLQWRRWVWFNVDYRTSPPEVIDAVNRALQSSPIPGVAADPAPHAILMDFADSYGRYAARYWLTDIARDDPTDSLIRCRIFFALKRAGIRMSIPAQTVFVLDDQAVQEERKSSRYEERARVLAGLDLFADLSDDERTLVAADLRRAPFAAGELVTRQGNTGNFLYVLMRGRVSVDVKVGEHQRQVAVLEGPDYFGEMSLMTGEPRRATVTALTDIDCFRLSKATFERLIHSRPELAEQIAATLARRRVELDAIISELGHKDGASSHEERRWEILTQIRHFFGIR